MSSEDVEYSWNAFKVKGVPNAYFFKDSDKKTVTIADFLAEIKKPDTDVGANLGWLISVSGIDENKADLDFGVISQDDLDKRLEVQIVERPTSRTGKALTVPSDKLEVVMDDYIYVTNKVDKNIKLTSPYSMLSYAKPEIVNKILKRFGLYITTYIADGPHKIELKSSGGRVAFYIAPISSPDSDSDDEEPTPPVKIDLSKTSKAAKADSSAKADSKAASSVPATSVKDWSFESNKRMVGKREAIAYVVKNKEGDVATWKDFLANYKNSGFLDKFIETLDAPFPKKGKSGGDDDYYIEFGVASKSANVPFTYILIRDTEILKKAVKDTYKSELAKSKKGTRLHVFETKGVTKIIPRQFGEDFNFASVSAMMRSFKEYEQDNDRPYRQLVWKEIFGLVDAKTDTDGDVWLYAHEVVPWATFIITSGQTQPSMLNIEFSRTSSEVVRGIKGKLVVKPSFRPSSARPSGKTDKAVKILPTSPVRSLKTIPSLNLEVRHPKIKETRENLVIEPLRTVFVYQNIDTSRQHRVSAKTAGKSTFVETNVGPEGDELVDVRKISKEKTSAGRTFYSIDQIREITRAVYERLNLDFAKRTGTSKAEMVNFLLEDPEARAIIDNGITMPKISSK